MKSKWNKLLWPILIFLLIGYLVYFWAEGLVELQVLEVLKTIIRYFLGVTFWLSLAWLVNRLFAILVWDLLLDIRLKIHIPFLIRNIVSVTIFFLAILTIVGVVFQQSVTGLLAASGVVGLVVGLALEKTISDVFNGVVLSFDRPFQIGEHVALEDLPDTYKVEEMTWRTTRFETENNAVLIIPNGKLAEMDIINLTLNYKVSRSSKVVLDSTIPIERALIILESALKSCSCLEESGQANVVLNSLIPQGVVYKLNYKVDPKKYAAADAEDEVLSHVLRNVKQAGLRIGIPKSTVFFDRLQAPHMEPNCQILLENMPLFKKLSSEEISQLAESALQRHVKKDEKVLEIGDPGSSLFLIAEGLFGVYIPVKEHPEPIRAAYLTTGQFFGEMSLFTGAPRGARVVAEMKGILYEITKQAIEPLLRNRPELAEEISHLISARTAENLQKESDLLSKEQLEEEKKRLSNTLLGKIKQFFGL